MEDRDFWDGAGADESDWCSVAASSGNSPLWERGQRVGGRDLDRESALLASGSSTGAPSQHRNFHEHPHTLELVEQYELVIDAHNIRRMLEQEV